MSGKPYWYGYTVRMICGHRWQQAEIVASYIATATRATDIYRGRMNYQPRIQHEQSLRIAYCELLLPAAHNSTAHSTIAVQDLCAVCCIMSSSAWPRVAPIFTTVVAHQIARRIRTRSLVPAVCPTSLLSACSRPPSALTALTPPPSVAAVQPTNSTSHSHLSLTGPAHISWILSPP